MNTTTQRERATAQIADVIAGSSRIPRQVHDRAAVIVCSEGHGDYWHGVQFWTREMIEGGLSRNTDGTKSFYVQHLPERLLI